MRRSLIESKNGGVWAKCLRNITTDKKEVASSSAADTELFDEKKN